ncbi:hypothetical protein Q5P01_021997 [Channa striata]|uniref:E3 ubiquitin-protein ligase RNF220 middle domain-containing protein n=1 Tax=Channa striata TaxID=64152 RepID=A0AA88J886_CHASR|nr:hypothetical protein Q5P01_021997 [Channa striata]
MHTHAPRRERGKSPPIREQGYVSPEDCMCKKKMSLYDSQAPVCPICQVLLRPGELQEHMETEIERLANICLSKNPLPKDGAATPGTPKSMLLSVHIKREGESPVVSPLSSEDAHHSDRYQWPLTNGLVGPFSPGQ